MQVLYEVSIYPTNQYQKQIVVQHDRMQAMIDQLKPADLVESVKHVPTPTRLSMPIAYTKLFLPYVIRNRDFFGVSMDRLNMPRGELGRHISSNENYDML